MTLWGRNATSVTANSTTTKETSTGAPIGLWRYIRGGQTGTGANTPHTANANFGNTSPGSRANNDVLMFQNVTTSSFVFGAQVGIFPVSATEQSNNVKNASADHPAHAGWNLRTAWTGPIVNVTYTGTATSYTNGDLVTVVPTSPGVNATAVISTNATGGALTFKITAPGSGFFTVNATPNAVYQNSTGGATTTGSGATFQATAGGRAGRIHYETIVAMGSLGAQTAAYGTPATTATTGSTQFPGA